MRQLTDGLASVSCPSCVERNMYWVALGTLVLAAVFDMRTREIPNSIPVGLILLSVGAKVAGFHPVSWVELGLGVALAFGLAFVPFAFGVLGGGDVKLFTALGAALGVRAFLPFCAATALFGGVAALVVGRRRGPEIAYAPVMLAGLLALLPVLWFGS